jgi:hypothetical protein
MPGGGNYSERLSGRPGRCDGPYSPFGGHPNAIPSENKHDATFSDMRTLKVPHDQAQPPEAVKSSARHHFQS